MTQLNAVQAPLPYLAAIPERPYSYTYAPPPGVAQTNRRIAPQAAAVRDGRPIANQLSLDRHGFALKRHASVVANFYDEDEVRAVYYPECERLLHEATGAAHVVVFDHIVRRAAREHRDPGLRVLRPRDIEKPRPSSLDGRTGVWSTR